MMKPPVLLLDDDRKWLQICLARLPQTGYVLESTVSLPDALWRLENIPYPVVVCDLRLIGFGQRGGFKLLDRARDISEYTKVIIVTGYGGGATETARQAMEKGAFNYLTKPVDWAELDECIVMAIQCWRQEIEESVNLGFLMEGPELALLHGAEMLAPEIVIKSDYVQRRCADLIRHIHETLDLIKQYEEERRLAADPRARRRAERQIADLRNELARYEAEACELDCGSTV